MFERARSNTHTRRPVSIRFTFPFQMLAFIFNSKDAFRWNMFTFRNKSQKKEGDIVVILVALDIFIFPFSCQWYKNTAFWTQQKMAGSRTKAYLYVEIWPAFLYMLLLLLLLYKCLSKRNPICNYNCKYDIAISQQHTPEFHTMTNKTKQMKYVNVYAVFMCLLDMYFSENA